MMFSPSFIEIDSIIHKLLQKDTNTSNNRQLTGTWYDRKARSSHTHDLRIYTPSETA
jgi:hypothetical protein